MAKKKTLHAQVLDVMGNAFYEGHDLALHDAVVSCYQNKKRLPDWVREELYNRSLAVGRGEKPKKRMGRHAQSVEQQKQIVSDAQCFEAVNELRGNKTLTSDGLYMEAGRKVHASKETVRKAYARHKHRVDSGKYYVSLVHLGSDYVEFLHLNSDLLRW